MKFAHTPIRSDNNTIPANTQGGYSEIVPRDRKIFAVFFVHFVKMHIPSFAPGSRRKLWIPAYLMIISQFHDTDSFARKITGIPTL